MGVGEALIRYTDVEIHQQELCVLNDVNLELHKGEFVYLVGKVGSGKTSLLKTFYGELDIASGEAEVLGYDMLHIKRKHIPQLRRKLGIVFQDFQLLTDRTVYDNLEFVLRATGWKSKGEIKDKIEEVLNLVGMSNKGYKLPNELSGGAEEFIQHLIVFVVAFGMQVELQYSTRRMIFFHVLPESDFSVLLLVRTDNSFMYFTENDDFFFISGEQHQHPCSKISALT